MQIKSESITMVDIHKIVPNPKNANRHSEEQIKRLEKLIEYQGFRNPLIVSNRTGFLVVGHGRLEAAKNLNIEKLPVIYQDFKDEAQEYAYLISDNEIARWAELDKDAVYDSLKEIEIDDIELLGLEDFEIPDIEELDPQTDEDEVPDVEEPITKRGDVWLLGKHRLMCGDSTMIDDVEKLMNGEKIDIVITDPPYGINAIKSSWVLSERYEQYKNEENTDCAISFVNLCIGMGLDIIAFGGNYFANDLPQSTHWIVWNKRGDNMGNGTEAGDQSDCELAWSNLKKKNVKMYKHVWAGWFRAGDKKDELKSKVHPSQKPVGLFVDIFKDYKFNTIFDGFVGSGSILIASEKSEKTCLGMELDEKYCDVIINRWQNYTGKQATLESNGQTYEELKQERL